MQIPGMVCGVSSLIKNAKLNYSSAFEVHTVFMLSMPSEHTKQLRKFSSTSSTADY